MYRAACVVMAAMVLGGCVAGARESRTLKFPEGNGEVVYQVQDRQYKLYNVQEVTPGGSELDGEARGRDDVDSERADYSRPAGYSYALELILTADQGACR